MTRRTCHDTQCKQAHPAEFATLPGYDALRALTILASDPPPDSEAIGYTVYAEGPVPAELGLDRDALTRAGFEPKVGHTLVIPTPPART